MMETRRLLLDPNYTYHVIVRGQKAVIAGASPGDILYTETGATFCRGTDVTICVRADCAIVNGRLCWALTTGAVDRLDTRPLGRKLADAYSVLALVVLG